MVRWLSEAETSFGSPVGWVEVTKPNTINGFVGLRCR